MILDPKGPLTLGWREGRGKEERREGVWLVHDLRPKGSIDSRERREGREKEERREGRRRKGGRDAY